MIHNYLDKKAKGNIEFEFSSNGMIAVLERKYNESTGVKELSSPRETSSKHIDDLLEDINKRIAPLIEEKDNLTALRVDIVAKEEEREALSNSQ